MGLVFPDFWENWENLPFHSRSSRLKAQILTMENEI